MQTKNNNSILVPTDFSDVAQNALEHAITIAKLYNNDIVLLHIAEGGFLGSMFGGKDKEDIYSRLLQDKLDTVAADIKNKHNVNVTAIIREGKIYKTILEVSEEINCDSIIMGTNGAEGMEAILGSNSSRVISHSKFPVVVIKEKTIGEGYKNIVLPIDLTVQTKQKVKWAILLGKKFHSTIHIISIEEGDEFLSRKITANLKQVEETLSENNIKYTTKILDSKKLKGNFADETIHFAEKLDADLILIMSQQERENIRELIVGTYAQQIVNRQSKIPVMCINPTDKGMLNVGWSGF